MGYGLRAAEREDREQGFGGLIDAPSSRFAPALPRGEEGAVRYRRFGRSELEVSEVGFGVWTLASDWWGRVDDPQKHDPRRARRGINFIDTAPVYGDDGIGETMLADVLSTERDDDRPHDQVRVRHRRGATLPGPVGAPARLGPGVGPTPARGVAAAPRHRLHRPLPTAQHPDRAHPRRRAVGRARGVPRRRQGPRDRRRARAGDRLGRRRARSDPQPPDRVVADRVQRARAGAGPHVRGRAERARRRGRAHLAGPARVRLALGQDHARHRVPEGRSPRAPQPRQHARQLRQGGVAHVPLGGHRSHDRSGRDRRHPRQPRVHDGAPDLRVGRRRRRVRRRIRPAAHRRRDGSARPRSGTTTSG